MGLYSKPIVIRAASLMQVPPSGPGNGCEPALSFQFRMWSKPSIVALLHAPQVGNAHAAGLDLSTPKKALVLRRQRRLVRGCFAWQLRRGLVRHHGAKWAVSGSVERHARRFVGTEHRPPNGTVLSA